MTNPTPRIKKYNVHFKIPAHHILSIDHNNHNTFYQSLEDYFLQPFYEEEDPKQIQRCIEAKSVWEIRWYPITPISFEFVFAPTLEEALQLAFEVETRT